MKKKFNKYNNLKFQFHPNQDKINKFLEKIHLFGKIYHNNLNYSFKKCPLNIKEEKKFEVLETNIITKTGIDNYWIGTICNNELKNGEEHKWTIKILKANKNLDIMIGIAPINFDINSSSYSNCGWYLYCNTFYSNPVLYSGPPHNYNAKGTNLKKVKDEIIVIMNMNKRTLKFIIDNEDKGDSYTDIPIDKPLFPAIFLYHKDDSIEII